MSDDADKKIKKKSPKKKPVEPLPATLPWLGIGLGAAGLGSAGAAYGLASDKQVADVEKAIADYRPEGMLDHTKLPAGHTALSHYAATLSPAAGLKPFGIPVSDYIIKLRSDPDIISALGLSSDYVIDENNIRSTGGAPHYRSYTKGPVGAYAHQLLGRFNNVTDLEGLAPDGTNYSDWMGSKFHKFIRERTQGNHPLEMDTDLWDNDTQQKLLTDFHSSLTPAEQALRQNIETSTRMPLANQAKNYLNPAKAVLGIRKNLLNAGVTLTGAGAGGVAGHMLYDVIMDQNKKQKSTLGRGLAAGAGASTGGLLSYFLGTQTGRESVAKALRQLKLKALAAMSGTEKTSQDDKRNSRPGLLSGAGFFADNNLSKQANRCWTGYEPVPGKKPYSEDSCQLTAGKKKKKEKAAQESKYKRRPTGYANTVANKSLRQERQRSGLAGPTPVLDADHITHLELKSLLSNPRGRSLIGVFGAERGADLLESLNGRRIDERLARRLDTPEGRSRMAALSRIAPESDIVTPYYRALVAEQRRIDALGREWLDSSSSANTTPGRSAGTDTVAATSAPSRSPNLLPGPVVDALAAENKLDAVKEKTTNALTRSLTNTGMALGGAGLGGAAGYLLHKSLTGDDKENPSYVGRGLATGLGASAGGLAGYYLGTEDGRNSIAKALKAVKLSSDTSKESFASFLGRNTVSMRDMQ